MGIGREYILLQRRHKDGKKVINITNHDRIKHQNHYEILPHTIRKAFVKMIKGSKY